jgi:hypothetical protein
MQRFVAVNGAPPQKTNEPPAGFFRVLNRVGKDIGLGFHCPDCHNVFFEVSERAGVKHCGRVEFPPSQSFFAKLAAAPLPKYSPRPIGHRAGASVLVEV